MAIEINQIPHWVILENNPDDWCDSMEQDGTYIDHTFMEMSAQVLDSDIVIVPLHGTDSIPCHVIRAGLLGNGGRGRNPPIFIGYFEEDQHSAGHFQSLMPYRDGPILDIVKNDGGVDVVELLNLPACPPDLEEEEMSFAPSINSTHFSSALVTPRPRSDSDVHVTPPPSPTPFRPVPVSALPGLTLSESLAEALATPASTPPLAAPPAGPPPRKRARSPSPIPIMRLNRNKQNDEWMKLAAATRKSSRIRDQKRK